MLNRLIMLVAAVGIGGAASFVLGESLPRKWFSAEMPFFRCYSWEKGGRFYQKLGVHKWKDHMPDMSRIVPGMVKKKAALAHTPENMSRLVQELCVAELVHWLLIIFVSPLAALTLGGVAGIAAGILYALGNLVFVIIQRYNRPRLYEIQKRMEKRRRK